MPTAASASPTPSTPGASPKQSCPWRTHTGVILARTKARAALRVLIASRDHISTERTAAINALYALLRVVDFGIDARGTLTAGQIAVIAAWRSRTEELATGIARTEAVSWSSGYERRTRSCPTSHGRGSHYSRAAPQPACWTSPASDRSQQPLPSPPGPTLDACGPKPRSRASRGHPDPRLSGNTVRHRISRGGDRRFNRALHIAVLTRMRMDPTTRDYIEKRTSEGRTLREIRRSLKRYFARQIYRQLNAATVIAAAARQT